LLTGVIQRSPALLALTINLETLVLEHRSIWKSLIGVISHEHYQQDPTTEDKTHNPKKLKSDLKKKKILENYKYNTKFNVTFLTNFEQINQLAAFVATF
jgi:hypothetical protein